MTIDDWQNYVASLPEKQFFSIMRLYLGEIKTPYNKHRLISQLASFIRNEENSCAILAFLDDFDLKLLTAINFIPSATQTTILEFFANEYEPSAIYTGLVNLTERLLIFSTRNFDKECFYINPLLQDRLNPYLNMQKILPVPQIVQHYDDDFFAVNANFLAAFISYLKIQRCSSKLDGTLKKNDLKRLEEIFPGKTRCLQFLAAAFMNLGILRDKDGVFEIDLRRLENFAGLAENQQYAFLCAASVSRFGREGLKNEALLLLDCLASVPDFGTTRSNLVRLAFIINSGAGTMQNSSAKSRFSQLLDAARAKSAEGMQDSLNNANLLERMLDSAIEFGLLQKTGATCDGEEIFKANKDLICTPPAAQSSENPKVLNIDSTFTVSLMPGLSLKQLLPLTDFMLIKKFGVVTEFEVTRNTVSHFFDGGKNPEQIFALINDFSYYDVPQNLRASIIDWYSSYSSAVLYKGYVLKVTETNIALVENNPKIRPFLKEKLADGIYLLNIPDDGDVSVFMHESGLELLGAVKTPQVLGEQLPFPVLRSGKNLLPQKTGTDSDKFLDGTEKNDATQNTCATQNSSCSQNASEVLIAKFKDFIEQSDFDAHQKESLLNRISRRLIISKSQLTAGAVRSEILEADGMDFSGKIHLIEAAIKDSDLLEITLPDYKGGENYFTLVGTPLGITRTDDEAVLRLSVRPSENIENVIVSRITYLRRLRF